MQNEHQLHANENTINSYNDFENYLMYKFKAYLKNIPTSLLQEKTTARLQEELQLLKAHIDHYPEEICGLQMVVFLGQLQEHTGILVRNKLIQCPFIMYLVGLTSYNALEKGFLEKKYLYEKSRPNLYEYYVGHDFYSKAVPLIAKHFEKYGYHFLWIDDNESTSENVQYSLEISDCSFILTKNSSLLAYSQRYLSTLENGVQQLSSDGFYQLGKYGLIKENLYIMRTFPKQKIYESPSVYTREDLWNELIKLGMCEKRAYFWTELIRKGKLLRMIRNEEITNNELRELSLLVGENRMEHLCQIRYLPTRWGVLEDAYYYSKNK